MDTIELNQTNKLLLYIIKNIFIRQFFQMNL